MGNFWKVLWVFGLPIFSMSVYAGQINVNTLQYTSTPKQNRMMFDVSAAPKHRVFVMDNPSRLVIDIKDAQLQRALKQPPADHPLFAKVRSGIKDKTDLRVVVDLKVPISSKKFSLNSNKSDDHNLIVDLFNKGPIAIPTEAKAEDNVVVVQTPEPKAGLIKAASPSTPSKRGNSIVIAIDPGHGGNDPGAHGPQGTEEKKVTFAIAKKLATLINGQAGMKAVMIRTGDYYVGLRDRMAIARTAKADLFVSIHADAFQDATVKGASIYTLSTNGASSEAARWLADSENASDLVGVSLNDKDDVLASVLLDLSQTATQEASVNIANQVLRSFDSVSDLHKVSVQKAGFIVLKSPDIPSILVETAFISNPLEEQNLLNPKYQAKMANAIFKGVRTYFNQSAPIDNKIAALDK
ncbi:MAG: N-acetylmuramoyl-L-alanine amidase [Methylococcales bacterium]|nr:N-acetylmuramoyl-L-alanine amidase [Methylococcales bacterium]